LFFFWKEVEDHFVAHSYLEIRIMGSGSSRDEGTGSVVSESLPTYDGSKWYSEIATCCSCQSDVPRRQISVASPPRNSTGTHSGGATPTAQQNVLDLTQLNSNQQNNGPTSRDSSRFTVYQTSSSLKLFPGWTREDRYRLEYAIESIPRKFSVRSCRKGNVEFMDWMESIAKRVPGKTANDCAAVYLDMMANRVAVFGAVRRKDSEVGK
jgi:hypothetical protein